MAKTQWQQGFERTIGELIGTVGGMKDSVDALGKRFEQHLSEHRATWLWVFPTLLSLGTLVFMIVVYAGGGCGN